MSDRISEEPSSRKAPRRASRGRFLIISIVFHVLLALVATYLVVQTFTPRKQTFKAASTTPDANREVEHKVQVAKKQQSMTAPPMKRIATTGLSKVALPEMPDVPAMQEPGKMQGTGTLGAGLGIGGMGGAPGGGAPVPLFGMKSSGKGLAGTFYDIKQTRAGRPNEFAIVGEYRSAKESGVNQAYKGIVAKFIKANLSTTALNRYFVGPVELYTTQIFIPQINSDRAPQEFDLKGKVEPRRWFVVYEGTVTPPQDGRYTFIGNADDVIAVKFNNRMVLGDGKAKKSYPYNNGAAFSKAQVGDTVEIKGGTSYPITIAIGEIPGGAFGAFLLIQKEGVEYKKDGAGNPILPVLKFAPGPPSPGGRGLPPIMPDAPWSVWKTVPAAVKPSGGLLP